MEIYAHSKLFDVIKNFPDLEKIIMELAPSFKNLKNPVLRKTVGKLATIEKIARIGNLEVLDLVNKLRTEVGQPLIRSSVETEVTWQKGEPEWITEEPQFIVDGTEMLSRGEHPLQKVNQLMRDIEKGRFVLLKTNFRPIPMIDEMEKQNFQVFTKTVEDHPDQHFTFIRK